jgi:hypothetical protein
MTPAPFNDFTGSAARRWYGQSLSKSYETVKSAIEAPEKTYFGRSVVTYASGWKAIKVPTLDIRDLLSTYNQIDLLDLDIQGEEVKILSASGSMIDSRVKRLHVGTHGTNIEAQLRSLLSDRGWLLVRDYKCGSSNKTPFGEIKFVDGVQSWLNPRFGLTIR